MGVGRVPEKVGTQNMYRVRVSSGSIRNSITCLLKMGLIPMLQ